ncbi:restriction endonuclease, partial [Bacillus toyonensis]|uniref:restriction endonuclease n=1 Tax=Bacillus toyonensis TaxID=155322 RepID=UPI003F6574E0
MSNSEFSIYFFQLCNRTKNRVGISAVQEVYAAQAYYKAHEGWVVTNSVYTRQAKELVEACHVKLI